MKRVYRLTLGARPDQQDQVQRIIEQELGYSPTPSYGSLDFSDSESAEKVAKRLEGGGIPSSIEYITEYDVAELNTELLRLIPLDECDNIRLTPAADWFTEKGRSRGFGEPITGILYFDYASASGKDLVEEPFSHEIIISQRLKDAFESRGVTGLAYWPLVDASGEDRPIASDIHYNLAQVTCSLPPLDPRVLVTPWNLPGDRWNYTVVSEYYYAREQLKEWCDFNRVYWDELSNLGVPPIIVSQQVRQLLLQAKVENVKYEPVRIVSENETTEIAPKQWSWPPLSNPQPILSLANAREEYPH